MGHENNHFSSFDNNYKLLTSIKLVESQCFSCKYLRKLIHVLRSLHFELRLRYEFDTPQICLIFFCLITGELLVIVEYCKYGNLHNLLLKHRDVFINQVDSLGNLDPSIKTL